MVVRIIMTILCISSVVASAQSLRIPMDSTDQTSSTSETKNSSSPQAEETDKVEVTPPPPPDLTTWYQKWRAANKAFAETNSKLIIISSNGKTFSAIDTDTISEKDSHHLFTPSDQERDLQLGINQTGKENPCVRKRPTLLKCLSARYILDVSKNSWEFLSVGKTDDKLSRIFTMKKDASNDYYRWLNKNLGFNARVLDTQNGYILALTPPLAKYKTVSGQIILDSSEKPFLRTSDIKLGENLELVSAKGRLAVLRITSENPGSGILTLKPSTKIKLNLPTAPKSESTPEPASDNGIDRPELE